MHRDGVHRINQLRPEVVLRAMATEGKGLVRLRLRQVFDAHTSFDAADDETGAVQKGTQRACVEFEKTLAVEKGLGEVLQVVDDDLSLIESQEEFSVFEWGKKRDRSFDTAIVYTLLFCFNSNNGLCVAPGVGSHIFTLRSQLLLIT